MNAFGTNEKKARDIPIFDSIVFQSGAFREVSIKII